MWAQVAAIKTNKNKYRQILDNLWEAHCAPRTSNAPTVISLFAGIGGSSLGYSAAGYRELCAVEWDKIAAKTFMENFRNVPVWVGDIARLTATEILTKTGLSSGELDLLDGSPPCQGFSLAGNHFVEDPRNKLYIEYVRLLRALMPKTFVMENVPSMAFGKTIPIFVTIISELKKSGYEVKARVLDASKFGVPQKRKRMIFIGIRSDIGIIPTHPPPIFTRAFTLYDAIDGLSSYGGKLLAPRIYKQLLKSFTDKYVTIGRIHYTKLELQKPSTTIKTIPDIVAPDTDRFLSIAALKRISSFPDDFILHGKWSDQWKGLGNCVPPLMTYAIAAHLKSTVFDKIKK